MQGQLRCSGRLAFSNLLFLLKKQMHSGQVLCELGGERQDSRLLFQIAELRIIIQSYHMEPA